MNIAMILAGGSGKRMGASIPKQFIKVMDKPIIVHTLEKFQNHPDIDAIAIVCVEAYIEEARLLIDTYHITKVKWVFAGGDTFQDSVCNGLFELRAYCADDDILMIHMSVAPFIESDIIDDAIHICKTKGNSISANPCLLCMGSRDNDEYSTKSVLRETIIGLNTPQTFYFGDLHDAYRSAVDEGYLDKLEPHTTSLLYKKGIKLYFSKGSQMNIKITTRDDLDIFEAYCIMKQNREKSNL